VRRSQGDREREGNLEDARRPGYLRQGEDFEPDKLQAYPPGAVIVLPGDTPHFHWAKSGEYITQVTALGPISLDYIHPGDDPRH
jgi:hypothetical protein